MVPEKPFELLDFLKSANLDPSILKRAIQEINALCAKAEELSVTSNPRTIKEDEYMPRIAKKAIVMQGKKPTLCAGDTIHYLSIGNDENLSVSPFLDTLQAYGINTHPFDTQADTLVVLFWRRYQAFKGKISLSEEEISFVKQAQQHAKHTIMICLSNPWTSHALKADTSIFTFSPTPAFQQAAAECILGILTPEGKLPVIL